MQIPAFVFSALTVYLLMHFYISIILRLYCLVGLKMLFLLSRGYFSGTGR